jgi:peptide/nickel transport system permease protein
MLRLAVRRLFASILTLVGVTMATFVVTNFIPGDPLAAVLGQRAMSDPQVVETYRARWGLDRSLPERYGLYVWNLAHGDLGTSLSSQRPVAQDLAQYLPATAELTGCALVIALLIGVSLGVVAAMHRNAPVDHAVRLVALIGSSLPVFWLALIALQVFYAGLGWMPGPGRLDTDVTPPPTITGSHVIDALIDANPRVLTSALAHLVLPSLVLSWFQVGMIARVTRASMLDVLGSAYIQVARAKGLRELTVMTRHGLRTALLPTVTVVGLAFASLMAGAVMTETVFAWPGIGRYAVQAASNLDFPAIMGITLLVAVLYLTSSLVVDILYGILDPRLRVE